MPLDLHDIGTIREIYAGHRRALYVYARTWTRTREAAEDLVHQAFSELLMQNNLPDAPVPYLYRAIRNRAIDQHRKQELDHDYRSIFRKTDQPDTTEARLLIEEILQQLSADEREVIIMKAYTGMTFKEIATVKDVSINTVSSWYRRGLIRMRTLIEEVANG